MLGLYMAAFLAVYYTFDWVDGLLDKRFGPDETVDRRKQLKFALWVARHPWEVCLFVPLKEERYFIFLAGPFIWFFGYEPWWLLWDIIVIQALIFSYTHKAYSLYGKIMIIFPFGLLHGALFVIIVWWHDTFLAAVSAYFLLVVHHAAENTYYYFKMMRDIRRQLKEQKDRRAARLL